MQGVFTGSMTRFATKKALKMAVSTKPSDVILESTAIYGTDYAGPLHRAPAGRYDVVGPDPYTRKWYANVFVIENGGHRSFRVE